MANINILLNLSGLQTLAPKATTFKQHKRLLSKLHIFSLLSKIMQHSLGVTRFFKTTRGVSQGDWCRKNSRKKSCNNWRRRPDPATSPCSITPPPHSSSSSARSTPTTRTRFPRCPALKSSPVPSATYCKTDFTSPPPCSETAATSPRGC